MSFQHEPRIPEIGDPVGCTCGPRNAVIPPPPCPVHSPPVCRRCCPTCGHVTTTDRITVTTWTNTGEQVRQIYGDEQ